MPGNEFQRHANLRALYGYQWTHPGTHLLFMGGEIAQPTEWGHDRGVTWDMLQYDYHKGCQNWVKALVNHFYRDHPALWRYSFHPAGFEWMSGDDTANSVLAYLRKGLTEEKTLLIVCHFNADTLDHYQLGVPYDGEWTESAEQQRSSICRIGMR